MNKYQYCYNNPLLYIDPDGHQGVREWFRNTLNGAASTVSENNGFGRMDAPQTTTGRAIGHVISLAQSAGEIYTGVVAASGGGAEAVVTSPACGTGVGCAVPAVGVGTVVVGVVVATHGTLVGINTVRNIFSKNNSQGQGEQPYENTPENQERMKQGKPPIGKDGKPVEIHHEGQRPNGPVREMTRTDHRGKGNYSKNHPERGPSQIDRNKAATERRRHWKDKANQ